MSPSDRVCPRCGAQQVYRSRPRSFLEELLRDMTPLRVTRCHACGYRAWGRRGSHRSWQADQKDLGLPARPFESRDGEWRRRRMRRLILTAILAAGIGAATALWFIE